MFSLLNSHSYLVSVMQKFCTFCLSFIQYLDIGRKSKI